VVFPFTATEKTSPVCNAPEKFTVVNCIDEGEA
jgi:hypothetical protein